MRPIKCRGRMLGYTTGGWVYGSLVCNDDFAVIIPQETIQACGHGDCTYQHFQIDRNTIGEYTGAQCPDHTGALIDMYEGDYVTYYKAFYEDCFTEFEGYIVFHQASWLIRITSWSSCPRSEPYPEYYEFGSDCDDYYENFEVHGNIYDNPELLKGK